MAEKKSTLRWMSYINMACIKSFIDMKHYASDGTVDTWFHGWQPLIDHPIAACVDILFDAGSVIGLLLTLGAAAAQAKEERRTRTQIQTPAA